MSWETLGFIARWAITIWVGFYVWGLIWHGLAAVIDTLRGND